MNPCKLRQSLLSLLNKYDKRRKMTPQEQNLDPSLVGQMIESAFGPHPIDLYTIAENMFEAANMYLEATWCRERKE